MDSSFKSRIHAYGYKVAYSPPGDGNCFYAAAAYQLGLGADTVKNAVFDYLERHQFDVSIAQT